MSVYLSCNWYKQLAGDKSDPGVKLADDLQNNGINLIPWQHFGGLTHQENALASVSAIQTCDVYAAVLTDSEHKYSGTLELLAMAIGLDKKVVLYIEPKPTEQVSTTERVKAYNTAFDRYLLYHPDNVICYDLQQFRNAIISSIPSVP